MKIPRDISVERLIHALHGFGYTVTRQRGSHIRITTAMDGEHHEVIPRHNPSQPPSPEGEGLESSTEVDKKPKFIR